MAIPQSSSTNSANSSHSRIATLTPSPDWFLLSTSGSVDSTNVTIGGVQLHAHRRTVQASSYVGLLPATRELYRSTVEDFNIGKAEVEAHTGRNSRLGAPNDLESLARHYTVDVPGTVRRSKESTRFGRSPKVLGRNELPHRALDTALASPLIEFSGRPREGAVRDKDTRRGGRLESSHSERGFALSRRARG